MQPTQDEKAGQSATMRAEELFNRMGKGLGTLAASTSQRVQNAATLVRERVEQRNQHAEQPNHAQPTSRPTPRSNAEVMAKADELVGQMEARLSYATSLVGFTLRKTAARLREEAEDMWAEAQHLRHQHRRPS